MGGRDESAMTPVLSRTWEWQRPRHWEVREGIRLFIRKLTNPAPDRLNSSQKVQWEVKICNEGINAGVGLEPVLV